MPVRREPRLLDDVLRLGVVADDRPRRPVDALVVPAQEQLEELDLSGPDSGDGFFVRENGGPLSSVPAPSEGGERKRLQSG